MCQYCSKPTIDDTWGEKGFCIKCGNYEMIHYDTRKCEACTQWAQIFSQR